MLRSHAFGLPWACSGDRWSRAPATRCCPRQFEGMTDRSGWGACRTCAAPLLSLSAWSSAASVTPLPGRRTAASLSRSSLTAGCKWETWGPVAAQHCARIVRRERDAAGPPPYGRICQQRLSHDSGVDWGGGEGTRTCAVPLPQRANPGGHRWRARCRCLAAAWTRPPEAAVPGQAPARGCSSPPSSPVSHSHMDLTCCEERSSVLHCIGRNVVESILR